MKYDVLLFIPKAAGSIPPKKGGAGVGEARRCIGRATVGRTG